uniref:Uncharacterized protein n=1 Tax=Romanomermis culicivorax TaxID=13658 RepID=A0A915I1Y5_ROMCU
MLRGNQLMIRNQGPPSANFLGRIRSSPNRDGAQFLGTLVVQALSKTGHNQACRFKLMLRDHENASFAKQEMTIERYGEDEDSTTIVEYKGQMERRDLFVKQN